MVNLVNNISYIVGIISATILAYCVFDKLMIFYQKNISDKTKSSFDDEFIPFIRRLLNIIIPIIGCSILLCYFGLDPKILLSIGGAGTLALALIVKDSVKNIIDGLTIMLDKPFIVGDIIKLPTGEICLVEKIGLRRTIFKFQDSNNKPANIILPNCDVSSCKIINYSKINQQK